MLINVVFFAYLLNSFLNIIFSKDAKWKINTPTVNQWQNKMGKNRPKKGITSRVHQTMSRCKYYNNVRFVKVILDA